MDPLAALLDGPRARDAFLIRAQLDPPWSMRVEDEAPLAVVVMGRGEAWVEHDGAEPVRLGPGDVALVRGPDHYVVGDSPSTAPQIRIDAEEQCWSLADGRSLSEEMSLGLRTWGTSPDAACTMLVGCYDLTSQVTPLLLDVLPRLAVIRQEQWRSSLPALLLVELRRDGPGQEVILDRLLDLVLIEALRTWFADAEANAPRWWLALDDTVAGPAVRVMQQDPAHPWTVASLAGVAGVSRAALARRFTEVVGEPPMAFLTDWRLSLAADRLRGSDATIAAVAREVGYGSPFALSTAFKRRFGLSPKEFRASATATTTRYAAR